MVVITFGALLAVTNYAALPAPRVASSVGLQEYANKLVKSVDENNFLTNAVFSDNKDDWDNVITTIGDSISPNILFSITAYEIDENEGTGVLSYVPVKNGTNFKGAFPSGSVSVTYTVTSPKVTVTQTPEKIAYQEAGGKKSYITLYILNCANSRSWWITGYSSDSLAQEAYKQMSPYFETTIMVNSTAEFESILSGNRISGYPTENIKGAVIINTHGECVPIPASQCGTPASRARFSYEIGKIVTRYNWTWVSIVGYPFYYVSNTDTNGVPASEHDWGIYRMDMLGQKGLKGFLEGLDGLPYSDTNFGNLGYNSTLKYTTLLKEDMNYYGIYPGHTLTATRAIRKSDLTPYHLTLRTKIINGKTVEITNIFGFWPDANGYYAAATWSHLKDGKIQGSFLPIGLARTPDLKVAILGILAQFRPSIYRSDFTVKGTTRIIILQLGQSGAE
jgi:hypothetical protein